MEYFITSGLNGREERLGPAVRLSVDHRGALEAFESSELADAVVVGEALALVDGF